MSLNVGSQFGNRFPLTLVNETAARSLDKKGRVITAGKKMTRLRIGDDSRYWIAAKRMDETHSLTNACKKACNMSVKVCLADNSFALLNSHSLARRLHLKKKTIKQLIEKGSQLGNFLLRKARQASLAVSAYDKIINANQFRLPSARLMKIIRESAEKCLSSLPYEGKIVKFKNQQFIAYLSKNRNLKLYAIGEKIGQGSCGYVNLARALHKEQELIFKTARQDIPEREFAELNIKNEFAMLCKIHALGKMIGIQERLKLLITMTLDDGTPVVGHLGKKYDEDYLNNSNEKTQFNKFQLIEFYQLLIGLRGLKAKGIVHGDIKRENIFVKTIDGKKWLFLADFGDARDSQRSAMTEDAMPKTFTTLCRSTQDIKKINTLLKNDDKINLVKLLHKMDVFAMGIVFYETITNAYPFKEKKINSEGVEYIFPDISAYDAVTLINSGAPKEIQTLIEKMLDPDDQNRISASDAFTFLDAYIRENYDDLFQELDRAS